VAVVAILTFQNTWTDLLGPVIYLNSTDKYTLAIGVYHLPLALRVWPSIMRSG
jgi:ABC-type glycerol-3-phosphate transport system permease component